MTECEKLIELTSILFKLRALAVEICHAPFWKAGNGKAREVVESVDSEAFGMVIGALRLDFSCLVDLLEYLGASEPEFDSACLCPICKAWYPNKKVGECGILHDDNLTWREEQILCLVVLVGEVSQQIFSLLKEQPESMKDALFRMKSESLDWILQEIGALEHQVSKKVIMLSDVFTDTRLNA